MATIYDFKVKKRDGSELDLATLKGKVLLIVNTATGCGFTPQYEGIEKFYEEYHDKGFEVLDFPCDQFGHQAPGDDDEIHEFCTAKYKTQFDQLAKIEVNGDKAEPIWNFLKEAIQDEEVKGLANKAAMATVSKIAKATGGEKGFIRWNFTKFLVDREGNVVGRYAPTTKPEEFEGKVRELVEG
ncbi:glutathione peroxidase [Candidatus Saccharibacteria bacterium]|nr:glutathione peroxidase [Candidatus Saccharibacteria bacterium]